MTGQRFFADTAGSHVVVPGEPGKVIGGLTDSPGCRVLGVAILPGHPTAEDVARVEVGMAGYQLS